MVFDEKDFGYYKKLIYKNRGPYSMKFEPWRAYVKALFERYCEDHSVGYAEVIVNTSKERLQEFADSRCIECYEKRIASTIIVSFLAYTLFAMKHLNATIWLSGYSLVLIASVAGVMIFRKWVSYDSSCAEAYAEDFSGVADEFLQGRKEKEAGKETGKETGKYNGNGKAAHASRTMGSNETQGTKDPVKTNALIEEIIQNQRNRTLDECRNVIEEIIQEKRIKSPDSGGEQECTVHLNLRMTCPYPLNPENDLGQ